MQLLVREALLHVQVPDRDGAITVADRCESVERVAHHVGAVRGRGLGAAHTGHHVIASGAIVATLERLLLVREGDIVHFGVAAGIDLAHGFLAPDVEEKDLLVCAHTDGERAICSHLDAVNVTTVSTKIGNVDSSLTIPDFHIFVDLATRQ